MRFLEILLERSVTSELQRLLKERPIQKGPQGEEGYWITKEGKKVFISGSTETKPDFLREKTRAIFKIGSFAGASIGLAALTAFLMSKYALMRAGARKMSLGFIPAKIKPPIVTVPP